MSYIKRITFLLALIPLLAHSQTLRKDVEIGVLLGGMNYIGDLNSQSMLGKVNPAASALVRYDFHSRWAVQFGFAYGNIEGGNPDAIEKRNLSFRSQIIEGSLTVQFNFVPYQNGAYAQRFTPYMFAGIGVFGFNPKTQYNGNWYELQPLCTEGQGLEQYPDRKPYSLIQLSIPFGLGLKCRIGKYFTVGAEYGFRKTWTDYLDDVSTTYVDPDLLTANTEEMAAILSDRSGEIELNHAYAPGTQRGDDSLDDWYAFFGLSITVKLNVFDVFRKHQRCDAY
ncbi:MAG: outer membrane beta-barrel protein [Bacteroidales bacterium]|nr:outer membrane beta-barrel protein [Bacteroidales bacterium]MBR5029194.1 outer membrane beta-barrel protein [Bacteroidales bacterium]